MKIEHGGLIFNANLNLAPGNTVKDEIVLMLHGTMAHKDMEIMRGLQDMLIERKLSNLAINLSLSQDNRHGMKNCATPHRHLDSNALNEIGLWVNWLKKNGAKRITLLGHSRGGNQIARYAAQSPDDAVEKVIVIAPPTWEPQKLRVAYKKRFNKRLPQLLKRADTLISAGKGKSIMTDVNFLYCPKSNVAAATFADYYKAFPDRDTPSVIKKIKLPLLAIVGDKDRVVPNFANRMKTSNQANVKLVVLEDAGHFFRDLFGEDLADSIADFMNNHEHSTQN